MSERVLRLVGMSGSAVDTVTRYEVELDEDGRVVRFDGSSDGDPSWRASKLPSCG